MLGFTIASAGGIATGTAIGSLAVSQLCGCTKFTRKEETESSLTD